MACRFHIYSLNCRYLQLNCRYIQFNCRYLQFNCRYLQFNCRYLQLNCRYLQVELSPNRSYLEISPIQLQISPIRLNRINKRSPSKESLVVQTGGASINVYIISPDYVPSQTKNTNLLLISHIEGAVPARVYVWM